MMPRRWIARRDDPLELRARLDLLHVGSQALNCLGVAGFPKRYHDTGLLFERLSSSL
jgi:hypothetical protein